MKNQVKQNKECALKKTETGDQVTGQKEPANCRWSAELKKEYLTKAWKVQKSKPRGKRAMGEALGEKQGQRAD